LWQPAVGRSILLFLFFSFLLFLFLFSAAAFFISRHLHFCGSPLLAAALSQVRRWLLERACFSRVPCRFFSGAMPASACLLFGDVPAAVGSP
jgi:hypothetical protein